MRESIAYLRDPDGFIAERHQQFGPVFGTTLFFRPTAVVGGPEAVEQFTRIATLAKVRCQLLSRPCIRQMVP